MSEATQAPWPPGASLEENAATPSVMLGETLEARPEPMRPADWIAVLFVGAIAILIWGAAAFMLTTTLLRWSSDASFHQCVAEATSVSAQPARCLTTPGG